MTGSFLAPGGLLLAYWATTNVELAVCLSAAGMFMMMMMMMMIMLKIKLSSGHATAL